MTRIRRLAAHEVAAHASALGDLFVDAVARGASIGYMADLTREEAARYWRDVAAAMPQPVVLAAEDAVGIVGVVILAPMKAAFQAHRAEILKLVVHSRARGKGFATALMSAAEAAARESGRTHLSLMTRHGSDGDHLYRKLGWTLAGILPEDSLRPQGGFADAAVYYKHLAP